MMLHGDAVTGEVFTPRTPAGVTKGLSVRAFHHLKGAAAADRCCRPVRTDEGCPRSRGRIRVCQLHPQAQPRLSQALTLHHDAVGPTAQGAASVGAPMLCDRYVKGCRQPEV